MVETMKALIVKAPQKYYIEDLPVPDIPAGGLLLKVLACGLCGSDLRTLRSGHHRVQLPFTIGHEICGEVVQTGKEYTGTWQIGDILAVSPLVYCGECIFCHNGDLELCTGYKEIAQAWPGGFADYMTLPKEAIERGTIQKVPDNIEPVHATLVEPLSSCINAQEKGNTGPGDTVVISGAGPIGTLHLELSKARGVSTTIVIDVVEERLEMIKEYSPDYVINASTDNPVEEVKKLTRNYGADVIITANPVPETQVQAVEMAKKGGRILLFGGLPPEKATPGINTNLIHYNALQVIGTTIFAPRHNRMALEHIAAGRIDAEKFISHVFPLEKFSESAELALQGKVRKLVFIPM